MARRAKRADRPNPRVDRNVENYRRNNQDNVIELFDRTIKKKVDIIPRNQSQETLLESLADDSKHIVFAVGPAGCGKTLFATMHAIKQLKAGKIEKIVITRPNVAVDDRDIGFLPGDVMKKMLPWMMPILDVFAEYFRRKSKR